MGVVRTDKWLDEEFEKPMRICQKFMESFLEDNPDKIYNYLRTFGMYKPNRKTFANYQQMKELNIWDCAEKIFDKYKKQWRGPDIPVYIFPIASSNGLFTKQENRKSGVAFKDKLFLFISPFEDEQELEALFVHEYHHICRLKKQNKRLEEATLLDSIILEGLAEYAVETCCGKKYRADWCNYYTRKEIKNYWEKYIQKDIDVNKNQRLHDEILFGYKGYPKMIGYAAGYEIVSMFNNKREITIRDSFSLDSKRFLLEME
ncbi:DUF2268 domain-containing protein [Cytobacillus sp. FJAT-53684]|uniref:DUF2268 domain-containing protein n=1 Tax=Cytobacillus mangrovibacter TaxID=3299024 RepID=A0ABW6JWX6_9BACI